MMRLKSVVNVAMYAALGSTGLVSTFASAALVADGAYTLQIIPNPLTCYPAYGCFTNPGTDGNWNSTFSFNKVMPDLTSQKMTDNGIIITTPGGPRGSSVAGDGVAGNLNLVVTGSVFTINGIYQIDTITDTAGGQFAQYGSSAGGGGTINQTTGAMTLTPSGRQGAIDGGLTPPYDKRWNVDPADTTWREFTTGTHTTYGGVATGAVTGKVLTSLGDINGDGITDWDVHLVSAAKVGSDWGFGFAGQGYLETWDANLVSVVPLPAGVWLLGSGLVSLMGVARRRKNSRKLSK